jgi:hypothetical protein
MTQPPTPEHNKKPARVPLSLSSHLARHEREHHHHLPFYHPVSVTLSGLVASVVDVSVSLSHPLRRRPRHTRDYYASKTPYRCFRLQLFVLDSPDHLQRWRSSLPIVSVAMGVRVGSRGSTRTTSKRFSLLLMAA